MSESILNNLTPAQKEYLALVALGLTSKKIARLVDREPSAVDVACKRALKATGAADRRSLANQLREEQPEVIQAVTQRLGLSPKSLAELLSDRADGDVGVTVSVPTSMGWPVPGRDRRWNDLSVWQRRLWAVLIALGALACGALLLGLSRHVLQSAASS